MAVEWIVWNLCLAAVPAVLSVPLFARDRRPSGLWWLMLAVFVAFLPNAPYVLTDVIHFADEVRASTSDLHVAFMLIPKYLFLFIGGLGCYAFALGRLERWLRAQGWSVPTVLGVDITIHALCAVGVFLGRVFRFNSWDLVARPGEVAEVLRFPKPETVVVLTLTFVVLAGGSATLRAAMGIRGQLAGRR